MPRTFTCTGLSIIFASGWFAMNSITWHFMWNFTIMWPCIVTDFFIIKPTSCTNFPNLLRHETLHVSDISSAHHQKLIHCKLGTGICHTSLKTAFEQDQDGTAVQSWSCSKAVFKPVWHIPVPSLQWINFWWWTEELSETCRVSCRSEFGKLVQLVVFIIKKLHVELNYEVAIHVKMEQELGNRR